MMKYYDNGHRLTYKDKEIVLVGTAHVSKESVELVGQMIETERPETVSIELCQTRYYAITQKNRWQEMDLIKVIRQKKAFFLLANLILVAFQRKIGEKFGVQPGEEMMRAIQSAKSVGAHLHLADRDIRITLSRAWRLMGLWTKIKLLFQFMVSFSGMEEITEEDVEEMKDKDVLEALLSEIGKTLPEMKRVLIDERDKYLAYKIRNASGKKIVAVVGAGHVQGIQRYWDQHIDIHSLEEMPLKGRLFGILKWGIPALILGLIVMGFFISGPAAGTHMIKWWVLANGILAGLGAIIAMAHPLTILSAVIAAPLTSLNPLIAAGWVAGLVEILLRRPKVRDFEALSTDIVSVRGFWQNKVTKILLIVVFTNIGSSIGTFVAVPFMAKVLA